MLLPLLLVLLLHYCCCCLSSTESSTRQPKKKNDNGDKAIDQLQYTRRCQRVVCFGRKARWQQNKRSYTTWERVGSKTARPPERRKMGRDRQEELSVAVRTIMKWRGRAKAKQWRERDKNKDVEKEGERAKQKRDGKGKGKSIHSFVCCLIHKHMACLLVLLLLLLLLHHRRHTKSLRTHLSSLPCFLSCSLSPVQE